MYVNAEVAEIARELEERKDLKELIEACLDFTQEELQIVIDAANEFNDKRTE